MISLTVGELVMTAQLGVLGKIIGFPMSPVLGWKSRKLGPSADRELAAYDARRMSLIANYDGTLPEGSMEYVFPEGQRAKFDAALLELQKQPAELDCEPISVNALVCEKFPTVEKVIEEILGNVTTPRVATAVGKILAD